MASPRFVDQLNVQIGHEFAAHQQYVAIAVHFDALTMPRLAAFFYRQALEEREHAMMMVQYLIDADERVTIPGVASPVTSFNSLEEPIALALAQERRVADQINELTGTARDARDFASDQFMQWFIKEQVEEISLMSDLLTVVRRSKDDIEDIEEWVARETGRMPADPSAPAVAGAE